MFSKTSFKSFTHKAKKGVLTKIGMHEEKQEDPIFQAVLFSVTNFKNELKDISFKAHGLGSAGTGYNNALEFLCGAGLKGELLFDKEQKFIDSIKESLCQVLGKIIETDIPEMDVLVVKYKGAKLDYDRLYYQTVKDMTKKELPGTDDREEVHKNNPNLPILRESWEKAKKAVIDQRNVYKGRLDNEVLKALQEVTDVSDAPHHRLYIDYFKERILITSAMCDSGTKSARRTAIPIRASELLDANDSEEVEDEMEYKTSPVQAVQGENKVEPPTQVAEEKAQGSKLGKQHGGAADSSINEAPADLNPFRTGEQLEEVSLPPARLPPRPPKEEVEPLQAPPQAPVEQPHVPAAPAQVIEGPPQPPAVPNQAPAVLPQAPPVAAMAPVMPPQPPAVPDQEPAMPPQAPPVVEMKHEMPPQPPAVPDQEPATPRNRGMPTQPPAVPNQEPLVPPQAPVGPPQPPVGPPQPPAVPQQPPIGPPQPPVGPPQPPTN